MRIALVAGALALSFLTVPSASAQGETCAGQVATIVGTEGEDQLLGTDGPDVIAGLGGDDHIDGLGSDDVIWGGRRHRLAGWRGWQRHHLRRQRRRLGPR